MNYFKKLPNSVRYAARAEWRLLKKIPFIMVAGTCLIALPIIQIYFRYPVLTAAHYQTIYQWAGLLFTYWFFVGVVAIGCAVIIIMKGPAYVADAYELPVEDSSLEPKSH